MRCQYCSIVAIAALIAAVCFNTGCATVFSDDTTEISVRSNPPGADVFVNGSNRGQTPVDLMLSDDENYEIVVAEGDDRRSFQITRGIAPLWIILDVVFGLVPIVVDAITGDWYTLSPTEINVDFTVGDTAG